MLSKTQKISLSIFGAMFVVPEVLWSPVSNFIYEFFQSSYTTNTQPFRNNFLYDYRNPDSLKFVVAIQFIGIILFLLFWVRNKNHINSKLVFWSVLILSVIIFLFIFFTAGFVLTFSPTFPI